MGDVERPEMVEISLRQKKPSSAISRGQMTFDEIVVNECCKMNVRVLLLKKLAIRVQRCAT